MALSTEDQLAIQQLYARYNHAIDSGKSDSWAACFTPDGVFSSGSGTFAGTAALAEFATGFSARLKARHWTNNLVLNGVGEGVATGTCYLALFRLSPGEKPPATILTTAIYTDELSRTGDEWRFTRRTVTGDA